MTYTDQEQQTIPLYNVSEITFLIKSRLEEDFPLVRIKGEIGTFRKASSGHCYFVLKDRDSLINAVLFRFQAGQLDFSPSEGQSVIVSGRLSVYPQRGSYQIICDTMEKVGQGDLLLMLEERKRKLAAEGLFDPSRKIPLPLFPAHIGVVTSAEGAALQDIIRVLKRRMNGFTLYVYDSPVQGAKAPGTLIEGLEYFNQKVVDLIILARGGGSVEDLLAFSDDKVVRAVADSRIPVITGVGHEIDFSLADLAADVRAATPSAAAELVSQSAVTIRSRVAELKDSLIRSADHQFELKKLKLKESGSANLIRLYKAETDPLRIRADQLKTALINRTENLLQSCRHRLERNRDSLIHQSPGEILSRGFSLVIRDDRIISRASDLSQGDDILIQMQDGTKNATIKEDNS